MKHIYLEGKKTKRVDKVINELIKLVNDKNYDQFIKSEKGKITKELPKTLKDIGKEKIRLLRLKKYGQIAGKFFPIKIDIV